MTDSAVKAPFAIAGGTGPSAQQCAHGGRVMRGAGANALGVLAKVAQPLALVVAARLYGPHSVGIYAISVASVRLLESALTSGYRDAMVMYGGRYAKRGSPDQIDRLYLGMANALVLVAALSASCLLAAWSLPGLLGRLFPEPGVAAATRWALLALPLAAFRELIISMTRSLMIMRYGVLIDGVALPLSLLTFVALGGLFQPTLGSLLAAFVLSHAATAVLAGWAYARHFSPARLWAALRTFRFDRQLTAFAIPQNLNLTFTHFVSSVDVVMLGVFGLRPELVAFYSVGAQTVRELRSVRRSFSTALSPLLARLHHEARIDELSHQVVATSRWSLLVTLPVAIAVVALVDDLLLIVHPSFTWDTRFVLLLVVNPVLAAAIGMAGNTLVMTGHSRWNLLNSTLAAALNVGLNVLFIPRYGLVGAAAATMASGIVISLLQLVEARCLVGLRFAPAALSKPLVAGAVAAGGLAVAWFCLDASRSLPLRVALALCAVGTYVGVVLALRIDAEDRQAVLAALPGPLRCRWRAGSGSMGVRKSLRGRH